MIESQEYQIKEIKRDLKFAEERVNDVEKENEVLKKERDQIKQERD